MSIASTKRSIEINLGRASVYPLETVDLINEFVADAFRLNLDRLYAEPARAGHIKLCACKDGHVTP